MPKTSYEIIYAVVKRIPRGRVATYGQVAELARLPGRARQVGYALHSLRSPSNVPWHRVINANGEISRRAVFGAEIRQQHLLEAEGVILDARGRVSLSKYRWQERGPQQAD